MSVYYDPEDVGLVQVAEIDYASPDDYGFDYRVVWWHAESRKLYTGRDYGCSCPSPFEDFFTLEDLDELPNMVDLREEARREGPEQNTQEQIQIFLNQVETVLRRTK